MVFYVEVGWMAVQVSRWIWDVEKLRKVERSRKLFMFNVWMEGRWEEANRHSNNGFNKKWDESSRNLVWKREISLCWCGRFRWRHVASAVAGWYERWPEWCSSWWYERMQVRYVSRWPTLFTLRVEVGELASCLWKVWFCNFVGCCINTTPGVTFEVGVWGLKLPD